MGDGGLIQSLYRYNSDGWKDSKLHTRKLGGRRWAVMLVIYILALSKWNSPLSKQEVYWTGYKANRVRKNQKHPAVQVWCWLSRGTGGLCRAGWGYGWYVRAQGERPEFLTSVFVCYLISCRAFVIRVKTTTKIIFKSLIVEELEPLYMGAGSVQWCSHCGEQFGGSSKIKPRTSRWSSSSTWGIYPKELRAGSLGGICTLCS